MSDPQSSPRESLPEYAPVNLRQWLLRHLPVLLYGWFWFGMVLCGFLAPADRVQGLESTLITEGWHLSLMAGIFSAIIFVFYWWRTSRPNKRPNIGQHGVDRKI